MKRRLARWAARVAIVSWACIASLPALSQLLPPLPTGSLIVTITSPSSGSTVGGTILVNASVSIVGSLTVSNVDFFVDGNFIGNDTTASYSVFWNTRAVGNGSHSLTAVARDLLGLTFTSNPVTVTVFNDTTPPSVSISSPGNGATVSGTISVTANASDNVGVAGVQFRLDGANLGAEDTSAPYSVSWNTTVTSNGSHTLTAVARDAAGNRATSSPVTVSVFNDTTPPTVTINQAATQADPTTASPINFTVVFSEPVSGFTGADVTIGGTAGGTKTVSVTGGPSTYNAAVSGMSSSGTVSATIAAGRAQDAAGNGNTASTSRDNSVTFETAAAPTITNFTPTSGPAGTRVSIIGTNFNEAAAVRFDEVSATFTVNSATAIETTVPVAATTGPISVTTPGGTATSSNNFTVVSDDTTPPTVTITSPAAAGTVSGTVMVSAGAADNIGVAGVRFFVGTTEIGVEDTTARYEVLWDTTTVADGSQTLTALARDAAGNTMTSTGIPVTVSNGAGTTTRIEAESNGAGFVGTGWRECGPAEAAFSGSLAGCSDAAGDTYTLTFTGTAVSWIGLRCNVCGIATVSIDDGPTNTVDTAGAAAPGSPGLASEVVFTASGLAPGTHTLVITVTGTSTSGGAFVVVDAFDVTGGTASTATRIEEADTSAISKIGRWEIFFDDRASGGRIEEAFDAGARATLSFTGTTVSWVGARGDFGGIANIFLDGIPQGQVDTYCDCGTGTNPRAEAQVVLFTASGLDPRVSHTLAIEATGTANPAAVNTGILVDAFDVTP